MKFLYRISSGLWVVLRPKDLSGIVGILVFLSIVGWLIFGGVAFYLNAEEKKYLDSQGTAEISKEEKSGLQVYKVGIDDPLSSLKIQSALFDKNFYIYGVPVSIVYENLSPFTGEIQYDAIYSSIVSSSCLDKLQEGLSDRKRQVEGARSQINENIYEAKASHVRRLIDLGFDVPDFDMKVRTSDVPYNLQASLQTENEKAIKKIEGIGPLIENRCGKEEGQFPRNGPLPKGSPDYTSLTDIVERCFNANCAKCQIVEGFKHSGDCAPEFIEARNDSRVIIDRGDRRISMNVQLVNGFPFSKK